MRMRRNPTTLRTHIVPFIKAPCLFTLLELILRYYYLHYFNGLTTGWSAIDEPKQIFRYLHIFERIRN